jgi:hypothetical protein
MGRIQIEFVLNSLYAALVAGMSEAQRDFANDTLLKCANLRCAPPMTPDILRRIANNADVPETRRPSLTVITGGAA